MIHGDTFEHNGRTFRFEFERDNDHEPPWEDGDGHGIVSDWRPKDDKRAGEKVLSREDRWGGRCRFYDVQATQAKALKEGWGIGPEEEQALAQQLGRVPTKRQIVAAAVEREFQWIRRWCNDEWFYGGVVVTLLDEDMFHEDDKSVWGIESEDIATQDEVARQLTDELAPLSEFERLMDKRIQIAEKV